MFKLMFFGFRYDCRLGRETVTTYQLNVDLQRCAAPNKTADYQKVRNTFFRKAPELRPTFVRGCVF